MKPIKLTNQERETMRQEFEEALSKARLANGMFSYTKSFANKEAKGEERVTLFYTPEAYLKMMLLVSKFNSEVGWHGLVKRCTERSWLVYDVVMYDQVVTGTTVNTDEDGYTKFMVDLPEEKANNMFFHGHSHVNMGVTASGVDMDHRDRLISAIKDDGFYIFQIWNKQNTVSTAIYDIKNNVLYDTKDVDYGILFEDGTTSEKFFQDATEHVHQKKYNAAPAVPAAKPVQQVACTKKSEKYHDADEYGELIDDGMRPYGMSKSTAKKMKDPYYYSWGGYYE